MGAQQKRGRIAASPKCRDHESEYDNVCWMDQKQPILTNFCWRVFVVARVFSETATKVLGARGKCREVHCRISGWKDGRTDPNVISATVAHPVLSVTLPPSVPSTHHSHHPSPLHSFIPSLKPFFLQILPFVAFLQFLLQDWFPGFPGQFIDTSEHIRFLLFSFSVFQLLVFGSAR